MTQPSKPKESTLTYLKKPEESNKKSQMNIKEDNLIHAAKVNAHSIDFLSQNIISSDGYRDLTQYAADFAKLIAGASNSKFVEIAFHDQEILDMLCFVYPKLEKKVEPLAKHSNMLYFRSDPMFEVRESKIVSHLHLALGEVFQKSTINYRLNSFYVPILYNWMQKGSKIIGTVIIVDPSGKREATVNDVNTSKMVVSARSTKHINSFANAFVCDLKHHFVSKEFRGLVSLSNLS